MVFHCAGVPAGTAACRRYWARFQGSGKAYSGNGEKGKTENGRQMLAAAGGTHSVINSLLGQSGGDNKTEGGGNYRTRHRHM